MNETLKAAGHIGAELGAAMAEVEALREQVKVLQSDANSWQSGYDKGRHDGGKHRKSEVEQLRQHKNEYMDAAEATRKALLAEIESLRNGLKNARYRIEQGRVWNGMGWTLTGLHAHRQQKALDEIDAALSQQAEPAKPRFTDLVVAPSPASGTAPAQDEREAAIADIFEVLTGHREQAAWSDTCYSAHAVNLYEAGYHKHRPAQTEQQPIGLARFRDLAEFALRQAGFHNQWQELEVLAKDFLALIDAAPIAQTAPQPEQSGLVEALPYQTLFNAIAAATKSIPGTSHISISVEAFRAALSATPGPKQEDSL